MRFLIFSSKCKSTIKTTNAYTFKTSKSFGIGVILSTQNPVDIDYKGLSNIGTWFIGRLQTKQDKEKVIDGLSSANEGNLK